MLRKGQLDGTRRPSVASARDDKVAAMIAGNLPGNREAEAGPGRFGSHEGREQPILDIRVDAGAAIIPAAR